MTDDRFYRCFEERFYAPRERIKKLREVYLPFVSSVAEIYPQGKTFDVGCGRGEWLELMIACGLMPFGVDLDAGMLKDCLERKLPVAKQEGISALQTLADESQVIVSAFHVVEHLTTEKLFTLVREALRVLKPGGLLILETPNPENIKVATENFYLDPTHVRPVPSQLLSFIAEYHRFFRVKVLRLQEKKRVSHAEKVAIYDILCHTSRDYAVVAQKNADPTILQQFDEDFSRDYGLSLQELSSRFEKRLEDIELVCQKNLEAVTQVLQLQKQMDAIFKSRSWRVTRPLRTCAAFFRRLFC